MIICHVCKVECNDDAELCPVCGAVLKKEVEEVLEEKETNVIENPTLLASFEDIISAEIFKDILKDNEIPFSSSQAEDASIQVVFGGSIVAEEIYVADADLEKANELYEEFLNTEIEFDDDFSEDFGEEI
ncbi:MAG: DUF2007 domain-containing protein [Clostridia bacterium]|nr:DUF2007 domain-containing protein [Clostridia bacterium]